MILKMGDWNEIVMGRSSMGRARPLLLAMNASRRREEEGRERGPGVIPGGGRRVYVSIRNEGERVPGRENHCVFMARSRWFPAPIHTEIRKQPHTQPCCLALGSRSQSQPVAPTPHFLSSTPLSCSNPSSSPPCPCHNLCPCHRLPPTPPPPHMGEQKTSSESEDSDESLPLHL